MEQARLVDVRSPGEFAGGHLDGALNIPVGDLAKRMDVIDSSGSPATEESRAFTVNVGPLTSRLALSDRTGLALAPTR